jgi:dihydrofolate synthase/folylpolyglutamate synthase
VTASGRASARLFALQRFGVVPGLERVRALLERLGRPDLAFDAVLVAGTNGKGSTVASLDAMLRAGGVRSGRFVSPHLTSPGERVTVDGTPLSDAAFEAAAEAVLPHVEAVGATFFEALTALACLRFAEAGVRTAVLEVGLGGRLDATNALAPVASAIAQVALDHQAVLGDTLTAIAREKAGVLRPGRPAWTSAEGEARAAIATQAARIGSRLRVLGVDARIDEVRGLGWRGLELALRRPSGETLRLRTPLAGRHQAANVALAALLAGELGVAPDAVARGAAATRWPGRAETVVRSGGGDLRVVLDGAHNPAAAHALAALLDETGARPALVLGVARDKDVAGIAAELVPRASRVHVTRASLSPRALPPAELAARVRAAGGRVDGVHDDPRAAFEAAVEHAGREGADVPVLVTGSLYLVGELRPWLLGEPLPAWERWQ